MGTGLKDECCSRVQRALREGTWGYGVADGRCVPRYTEMGNCYSPSQKADLEATNDAQKALVLFWVESLLFLLTNVLMHVTGKALQADEQPRPCTRALQTELRAAEVCAVHRWTDGRASVRSGGSR